MYPYPSDSDREPWEDISEDLERSPSGTDCTGLIPAQPQSDSELENYNELYDFLPRAVPKDGE